MTAPDAPFIEAVERAYLAAHPEHADMLAELGDEERAGYLRWWLGTVEARRLMVAGDLERAGMPDLAEWVRQWRVAR